MHKHTTAMSLIGLLLAAAATPILAQSPTSGTTECTGICPAIAAPVCGTDGRLYGNSCMLRETACAYGWTANLTIAYEGPCRNENCDAILCPPKPSRPPPFGAYCGPDNIDYTDLCTLEIAACKAGLPRFPLKPEPCDCRKLVCEPAGPAGMAVPVCDMAGTVYPDICALKVRSCTEPDNRALTPMGCPATLLPSSLRPTVPATLPVTGGATAAAAPTVAPAPRPLTTTTVRVGTATAGPESTTTKSDAGPMGQTKVVVMVVAGAAAVVGGMLLA
ncbi:hypothetical protein HDU96_002900 [Phlyctochytrium bullatum]|nr:hypothetical protein HDU96_002900 [Phlyctochytrium bullatum]